MKAHRFQNLHIRRQMPIGPYIADFICHTTRIVIEIDGSQHGFDCQAAFDRRRDAWFASQGYKVLRFWNRDVLTGLANVLDTIHAHLPTDAAA